jgi:polar amino acid transport system permease protein
VPEIQTGIIALMLNSGAYIAEIIRAGITSVDDGQIEAGVSSGLNYFQRMRFIILPQALGATVPPLLGQSIVLVKDSALLSLISVMELTRCGQTMTSERFMPTEAFLTVAFFYMCIYFCLKSLADWSQKKLIFREAY